MNKLLSSNIYIYESTKEPKLHLIIESLPDLIEIDYCIVSYEYKVIFFVKKDNSFYFISLKQSSLEQFGEEDKKIVIYNDSLKIHKIKEKNKSITGKIINLIIK
jgi:hypothetical protein